MNHEFKRRGRGPRPFYSTQPFLVSNPRPSGLCVMHSTQTGYYVCRPPKTFARVQLISVRILHPPPGIVGNSRRRSQMPSRCIGRPCVCARRLTTRVVEVAGGRKCRRFSAQSAFVRKSDRLDIYVYMYRAFIHCVVE